MYTRSAAVGLWDREQRAGVIQAPRQILRAHFSCPGRHRNLVTQGLMRPALIIEEEPLADADAYAETIDLDLQVGLLVLQAAPPPPRRKHRPTSTRRRPC
jgi:hypothetical protein